MTDHIPPGTKPTLTSKDVFWLLETNWGPHIHYFGPTGGVKSRGGGHIGTEPHEFTKDVNNATRFPSREAATQFLDWMQQNIRHTWLGWKVAEHEWVGAAPETVSAPAAERVPLRYGKPFTGIHRGISRGGFHCTDNDCSCHLYQYPRAELKANVHCDGCGQDYAASLGHLCPAVNGNPQA